MISMAAAESLKNNNFLNSVSIIVCSDLDTYIAKWCLKSRVNQYAVKIISYIYRYSSAMDMYINSGVLLYLYECTMISMAAAGTPKIYKLLNSVSMVVCSDLDADSAK